jgi:hypothetical protein
MAHFYGGVSGKARTTATRLGSKKSGLEVFANGWDSGVDVIARYDGEAGVDEFAIFMTAGSNGSSSRVHLGTVRRNESGKLVFTPAQKTWGEED